MNKFSIVLLMTTLTVGACNNDQNKRVNSSSVSPAVSYSAPDVISIDTANKMIGSYLNSISYENNDTDVQSFIFSAALLRKYLDSISNSDNIAYIKLMFAHKLSYINAGHGNTKAGYSNAALTLVIAGYTSTGSYVLYPTNLVLDNSQLCPTSCPPGSAASSLLPNPAN